MELPAHTWPVKSPPVLFPIGGYNMSRSHPMLWTKDEVYKWIDWCIQEYSLGDIPLERFGMNGKALMLLSKDDFKERAPNAGDVLYTTLQKVIESTYSRPQPFPTLPTSLYQRAMTYAPSIRHHTDSSFSQVYLRTDNSTLQSPTALRFLPIPARTSPTVSDSDIHRMSVSPKTQDTFPSPPRSASESDTPSSTDVRRTPSSPDISVTNQPGHKSMELSSEIEDDRTSQPCDSDQASNVNHFNGIKHPGDSAYPKTLKLKNNKECRLLWEFIGRLLTDPKRAYDSCIKWEDESKLIFRITNPAFLAYLWGMQKNRSNMTYEKLSRALRYYYRMNIIEKVPGKRLTYRFMHPPDEIKVERATYRYRSDKSLMSTQEDSVERASPVITSCHRRLDEKLSFDNDNPNAHLDQDMTSYELSARSRNNSPNQDISRTSFVSLLSTGKASHYEVLSSTRTSVTSAAAPAGQGCDNPDDVPEDLSLKSSARQMIKREPDA